MLRKPVSSDTLKSVGYEPNSKILEVEFQNDTLYHYFNVPVSLYAKLMSTSSHGKYFDKHIKKAGYRYRKVR